MNNSVAGIPLIIEASLNGQTPKSKNPNTPYGDDEIVEQALACMDAGAAMIHNHTEEPVIGGSGRLDTENYASAWRKLMSIRPDAILTATMPVGQESVPVETRYAHIEAMAQEGLLTQGLCDPGSFNYAGMDEDGLFADSTYVYRNDLHDSRYYVETCRRLNIGLSISIFEPGFLKFVMAYQRAGRLPRGAMLKFYFGSNSMPFGLPPTEKALEAYLEMLEGCQLPWLVSSFGDDCVGSGIAEEAIKRGGHVQVGLEPYDGPRTPTNLELVEEVAALAEQYDRPLATPTVAAAMLDFPTYPAGYGSPA
ncbi:MAG: 3-keto-5-aminohexanoate cleavage protein [Halieaceae bacterium]